MTFELAHESVTEGPDPQHRVLVLHGIFGRGRNWRSLCRRVARSRPELEFVLVDLRLHGDSQGAPEPHTLAAAADDVSRLAEKLAAAGVIGHSFGGKVVLKVLARGVPASLRQAWVIDASPGNRQNQPARQADRVLAVLGEVPAAFPDRAAAIAALEARNLAPGIAAWLGQSFSRSSDGLFRGFDLPAIRALLADHDAADLWPVVESPTVTLRFVVGEKSDVVSASDRQRLVDSGATIDVIPGAGHWVHMDAPAAMAALFTESLL